MAVKEVGLIAVKPPPKAIVVVCRTTPGKILPKAEPIPGKVAAALPLPPTGDGKTPITEVLPPDLDGPPINGN